MKISWQPMTVEEYSAFERAQGRIVELSSGVFWARVRPCFYRPLLPFREYGADACRPPLLARLLGGCQYSVLEVAEANSFINLLLFQEVQTYALESLERHKRKQVKSAAKVFEVKAMTDLEEFQKRAYPVYLSFYARTGYQYKSERRDEPAFRVWAESIYRFPKVLVLGAYKEGELEAVSISKVVEDTLVYSMVFCTDASLRLNVTSLLLHTLRESAAASGAVKQIFVGMYKYKGWTGIDEFYLTRGCGLVRKPAMLRINPVVEMALRRYGADQYRKLCGDIATDLAESPELASRVVGEPGEERRAASLSESFDNTSREGIRPTVAD